MRNKVPQEPAAKRIKNFSQVALGFSKEQMQEEASRCLQCKNPLCTVGCPVGIDIPAFIKLLKEGKFREALVKIQERNNLAAVCGRVCPQEDQCEKACILSKKGVPINIGGLERFAADFGKSPLVSAPTVSSQSPKVAIAGSGPAGLTCAADLAKRGFQVVLFESLHIPGGVLVYGIPEFRLPKDIVREEVEYIKSLGVSVQVDTLIGNTLRIKDLFKDGFKAVFLALGAGLPQFLGIPGENLNRVYSANEFLTRVNLMKAYLFPGYATPVALGERVAVVGGGNVALDCARVAIRLGKKLTLVYRRSENEMPGRSEEIQNAKDEGVIFQILTQPVKVIGDESGFVKGLECLRMELGEPDESGRRRPKEIQGSDFTLGIDTFIVAIGQSPNPLLPAITPQLITNKNGTIKVDEHFMTSLPGVFAGGDIITGADTVISAMGQGKKAAVEIEKFIKKAGSQ